MNIKNEVIVVTLIYVFHGIGEKQTLVILLDPVRICQGFPISRRHTIAINFDPIKNRLTRQAKFTVIRSEAIEAFHMKMRVKTCSNFDDFRGSY